MVVGGYNFTTRDTPDLDYRHVRDVDLHNGKGIFNDAKFRTDRRATQIAAYEGDGIGPMGQ